MMPEQLEALIRYRIEQAHETLREADILFAQSALRGNEVKKMTTIANKSIPNKVFTLLHTLNAEQLVEVTHFMEFLKAKETEEIREDPFLACITREADTEVTLDQVRTKLSSIQDNLSDVVIKGREERL